MISDRFIAIKTFAYGIKCDAPGCGWSCDDIPSKDYKKWVDHECPACGANLMTKANYRSFRFISFVVGIFNVIWFPWLVIKWAIGIPEEKRILTHVDTTPDGKVTFTQLP